MHAAGAAGRLKEDAAALSHGRARRRAVLTHRRRCASAPITTPRMKRPARPPVLFYESRTGARRADPAAPGQLSASEDRSAAGVQTFDWKRPYLIIDPRAGHGAGIGGFKSDSQVGVALHDGHPVYFLVFRPHPEPGQTLADVMRAEAEFVREIGRRHPQAPKPIIVGNCQGGWATMVLAAANPDITGPLVINGAPLAYWSGRLGENPMRYNGGLLGGVAAGAAARRSRPRRVRRRASRLEFRAAQSGPQLFRQILRSFRRSGKRRASASSNSSAGGAASIS